MRKRKITTQNTTNSKVGLVLKKYVYIYRKYRYKHRQSSVRRECFSEEMCETCHRFLGRRLRTGGSRETHFSLERYFALPEMFTVTVLLFQS